MNEDSENKALIQRIVGQSLYWTLAIDTQGKRVLEAEKIKYHEFAITRMEEQFFLNAVNKSIRWLKDLRTKNILVVEIDAFFAISSMASLVRNKREHDDEYFGTQQGEEILSDASDPESNLSISVGQSVTVHRKGRILLGGTVDVQDVIEKSRKLATLLRDIQHEYCKERSQGIIKYVDYYSAPDKLISN